MENQEIKTELEEKANSKLNEDPTRISDNLNNIQQWLTTQSHLKCRTDEKWLLAFLRGCKYDLNRTKMKLDNFYSSRTLIPEFFENRDPFQPEIQEVLKAGFLLPLPTCLDEPNGTRIIYYKMQDLDDKKVDVIHIIKVYFMFLDLLLLEDDSTSIAGMFTIMDCSDIPARYVLQLTPGILKKIVFCLEDSYPIRIKKFYGVKAPLGVESIFSLMKSFMSKKLKNRFHVYGKKKSIKMSLDILPQQYMPEELGGDNGNRDELIEYWKNKMESYRDWFLEDDKYRTTENLRLKKPRTLASVFGIADSFNDLKID